jgi:hypothetical protein
MHLGSDKQRAMVLILQCGRDVEAHGELFTVREFDDEDGDGLRLSQKNKSS